MPYIEKGYRYDLTPHSEGPPCTAGELNFQITTLLVDYIECNELSYQTINDVVGALEGAKAEFYRRVAVPYEIGKIAANGDVYESILPTKERNPQPGALHARTSAEDQDQSGDRRHNCSNSRCTCRDQS